MVTGHTRMSMAGGFDLGLRCSFLLEGWPPQNVSTHLDYCVVQHGRLRPEDRPEIFRIANGVLASEVPATCHFLSQEI